MPIIGLGACFAGGCAGLAALSGINLKEKKTPVRHTIGSRLMPGRKEMQLFSISRWEVM